MKRLDASYYNEDYFTPGPKSSYTLPFTWEYEGPSRMELAQKLTDTFHPRNAVDVGCAKSFLCKALLKPCLFRCPFYSTTLVFRKGGF